MLPHQRPFDFRIADHTDDHEFERLVADGGNVFGPVDRVELEGQRFAA
jgi:hypothetical protein